MVPVLIPANENSRDMLRSKRLRHGTFIYHVDDMIGRVLDRCGEWSEAELSFLLDLLDEGDAVVDVGAHIGTFTVPFARKVGPRGAVVALEAQRLVFQNLVANVFVNNLLNVTAHNVICGREAYFLGLVEIPGGKARNSGGFRFGTEGRGQRRWNHTRAEPLDALLIGLPRLRLIKIDVEGFEQEVLAGARETVLRLRPLIHCECENEGSMEFLLAFARDCGYRLLAASFEQFQADNFFGLRIPESFAGARDTNVLLWPSEQPLPAEVCLQEVSTYAELIAAPAPKRAMPATG